MLCLGFLCNHFHERFLPFAILEIAKERPPRYLYPSTNSVSLTMHKMNKYLALARHGPLL